MRNELFNGIHGKYEFQEPCADRAQGFFDGSRLKMILFKPYLLTNVPRLYYVGVNKIRKVTLE